MATVNLTRAQCELLGDLFAEDRDVNIATVSSKGGYGNIVVERWGEWGSEACEYNEAGEWLRDVRPPKINPNAIGRQS